MSKKMNGSCVGRLLKDALDLINRQQAERETMQEYINCLRTENERLQAMVQTLAECRDNALKEGVKAVRKAKSENGNL